MLSTAIMLNNDCNQVNPLPHNEVKQVAKVVANGHGEIFLKKYFPRFNPQERKNRGAQKPN